MTLKLSKDNTLYITVKDKGRGIPVDFNNNEQRYNWELVFCEMYAGGKYGENGENYEYSLGLNGLGSCATQYASEYMDVTVWRDGNKYSLHFEKGEVCGEKGKELTIEGSPANDIFMRNVKVTRSKGYNLDSLLAAHPASPVAAYFVVKDFAYKLDLEGMKSVRAKLDASLNGTEYVNQIESMIARMEKVQVGSVAPDFTLPDVDGNPVSLSSFRGKYVLVDFWAAWCPDCRKENPNIVAAWEKYKDKNFAVLGVSLDRTREQWLAAIEKDKLAWTQVSDLKYWNSEAAVLYCIRWIPMSFLIDPEGKIVAIGLEGEELHNKLEELLK